MLLNYRVWVGPGVAFIAQFSSDDEAAQYARTFEVEPTITRVHQDGSERTVNSA